MGICTYLELLVLRAPKTKVGDRQTVLTIFSCPKPFRGHIDITQKNAIQSWQRLGPEVEVILMGDDEGTSEVAKEFGIQHIPDVGRNDLGTPLINSLFEKAQKEARYDRMCYVRPIVLCFS
jgi:hypothetical protein